MPKWLDLNEVDDDEILLKKNRMSRSLVLDTPEVADAAEEDFLDTMEPAKKSMTIFFMTTCIPEGSFCRARVRTSSIRFTG